MPVVKSGAVSYHLESVHVHLGGALTVNVEIRLDGDYIRRQSFDISKEVALPYWTDKGDPVQSRWDDLCQALYELLIAQGCIAGGLE